MTDLNERVFAQQGFRCRLEWGQRGARDAATRGDILVVVDTLSFSSAVITGVANEARIYPCRTKEEARSMAQAFGGEVAVHRQDVPDKGRYSLSPLTFQSIPPGTRVFLPSPNGGTCVHTAQAAGASPVFIGALLNAQAAGQAVAGLLSSTERAVTVLACGERWWTPHEDGPLRFALEDYLGAGAIFAAIESLKSPLPTAPDVPLPNTTELSFLSPEARVCAGAFQSVRHDLAATLWECGSGRELRAKGYADDVTHAAQWNAFGVVPYLDASGFLPDLTPSPSPDRATR